MDDLYQDIILDHYKNPRNYGKIAHPDANVYESNASCGDGFTFQLSFGTNKDGVQIIKEIAFEGQGCAISTAMSSLITQELKERKIVELPELTLDYMQTLLGIEVTLARQKCVMLPARAMQKVVDQ